MWGTPLRYTDNDGEERGDEERGCRVKVEAGDQDMLAKKPEVKMVLPAAVHHVRLARFRASSRCSGFDVVENAAGVGESVRGTSAECVLRQPRWSSSIMPTVRSSPI